MKQSIGRVLALMLCAVMLVGMSAAVQAEDVKQETQIVLSDDGVTVDGVAAGTQTDAAVYVAHDIVFYLEGQDFTYGAGTEADAHSQAEADAHTVVHIAEPGVYRVSGTLSAGQIAIDLGEDAKKDENAVVTLILDGVEITSTVAPAVIFYNVYECGSDDPDTATMDVSTENAGANVIIADGSVNTVNGSYVAKIYKSVELSEDGTELVSSKKLHKYDGALYSKRSMNVTGGEKGDGVLNIHAENEGLCTELHLTINGGVINIVAGNDGINVNEDNVSVFVMNGGELNITVDGSTGEGDGIDSNGWLLINGGKVNTYACSFSGDSGIDSDMGIYINGGEVVASGNMLDHISGGDAPYAVFQFASRQKGGTAVTMRSEAGETIGEFAPENDYLYLIIAGDLLTPGSYTLWQGETQLAGSASEMMGMRHGFGGGMPEGAQPPTMPEGMDMPEDFDPTQMTPPEGMEGMERPELPEGFDPTQMTPPEGMEGMERPELPEDFDPTQMTPPEGMEGMERPEDGMGRGHGGFSGETAELSTTFEIGVEGSMFVGVAPAQEQE